MRKRDVLSSWLLKRKEEKKQKTLYVFWYRVKRGKLKGKNSKKKIFFWFFYKFFLEKEKKVEFQSIAPSWNILKYPFLQTNKSLNSN